MQKKLDEANATIIKEKEAARKAIEEAPPVVQEKEVIVEDTKRIESLTAEIKNLKVVYSDKVFPYFIWAYISCEMSILVLKMLYFLLHYRLCRRC